MLDTLIRDIRFARRSLLRTPVLTAAALISIGVGISATTSVFSVVDAALFRPPPLPNADRLVMLYITRQQLNAPSGKERWSWSRSRLLRERATSFEEVASFSPATYALTSDEPDPVDAEVVSSSYWPALQIRPVQGRPFTPDEDVGEGEHPVAIVGYELWQRRYGGDPAFVGRTIAVNGVKLT